MNRERNKPMGRSLPLWIAILLTAVCLTSGFAPAAQKTEKRSVEGLIRDLTHPDVDRRLEAAKLLGDNKVREAVPALIKATDDPDPDVRYAVARALVQINDTRALGAFVKLARDSETRIQKTAVEGIVNIYVYPDGGFVTGVAKVVNFLNPLSDDYDARMVEPYVPVSSEAVNALIDLLFSRDNGLRKDAAVALGILRSPSSLTAIEDALGRESSDDIKVELIRAIYKIGDPEGGEAVVPLIRDPDKKVHDEAILTVGHLRVKSAVPVLNDLYRAGVEERKKVFGIVPVSGTDDLQKKVLEALAYIGDPRSKDIFEDALNDSRSEYRRFGAEGLGRMGDRSYTNLIATKYLRENDESAKLAMGYALYLLGREEHIVELVDRAQNDQAYYYLLDLPPDKLKALYPYLQTASVPVTVRLLDVVGLRAGADALPVVQKLTASENADVVSAANLALRRLRGRFPNA